MPILSLYTTVLVVNPPLYREAAAAQSLGVPGNVLVPELSPRVPLLGPASLHGHNVTHLSGRVIVCGGSDALGVAAVT